MAWTVKLNTDTIRSIQILCGVVLLLGQAVLQAMGVEPSWILVAAALSLLFGVPIAYNFEVRRRDRNDLDDGGPRG